MATGGGFWVATRDYRIKLSLYGNYQETTMESYKFETFTEAAAFAKKWDDYLKKLVEE